MISLIQKRFINGAVMFFLIQGAVMFFNTKQPNTNPVLWCYVHCLGVPLGPKVDHFSLPHLTVVEGVTTRH